MDESDIMELEVDLSSLEITHRKRRLSGVLRQRKPILPPNVIQEEPQSSPQSEETAPRRSSRAKNQPKPTLMILGDPPPIPDPIPQLDVEKDLEEIKKIYLNKTVKRLAPSLETIFEDPIKDKMMSSRKFRRVISFEGSTVQAQKVKKRMMKITKMSAKSRIQRKTTMKTLMKRLSKIDDSE